MANNKPKTTKERREAINTVLQRATTQRTQPVQQNPIVRTASGVGLMNFINKRVQEQEESRARAEEARKRQQEAIAQSTEMQKQQAAQRVLGNTESFKNYRNTLGTSYKDGQRNVSVAGVRDLFSALEKNREKGMYDQGGDFSLMSREGQAAAAKQAQEKAGKAQEGAKQINEWIKANKPKTEEEAQAMKEEAWDLKGKLGVYTQLDALGFDAEGTGVRTNKKPVDYENYREDYDRDLYDYINGDGSYAKRIDAIQTDEDVYRLESEMDDLWNRLENQKLHELAEQKTDMMSRENELMMLTQQNDQGATAQANRMQKQADKYQKQVDLNERMGTMAQSAPQAIEYQTPDGSAYEVRYNSHDEPYLWVKGNNAEQAYFHINNSWDDQQKLIGMVDENGKAYRQPGWNEAKDEWFVLDVPMEAYGGRSEKDIFNGYYTNGQQDEAMAFLEGLRPTLQQRRAKYQEDYSRESARQKIGGVDVGWIEGAGTILTKPIAAAMSAVDMAGSILGVEGAGNPYNTLNSLTRANSAVRDERGEVWDENLVNLLGEGAEGTGKFINGVVYSIADNMAAMGLGKAVGGDNVDRITKTVQWIMSTEAAADEFVNRLEEDKSPDEAAVYAIGSGIIEALTEKYSVEALFSPDVRGMLGNKGQVGKFIAKNFFTEGSEEVASDALSIVADEILSEIYDHESDIEKRYNQLIASGMGEQEASRQVLGETFSQFGQSFIAGGLSGGLMSGGRVATNAISQQRTGSEIKASGGTQQLVEAGRMAGEGTESAAMAQAIEEKSEKGKHISSRKVGQLAQNIQQDTTEQIEQKSGEALHDSIVEELRGNTEGLSGAETQEIARVIQKAVTSGQEALTKSEQAEIREVVGAEKVLDSFMKPSEASNKAYGKQLEATESARKARISVAEVLTKKTSKEDNTVYAATAEEIRQAEKESDHIKDGTEVLADGQFKKLDGVQVTKDEDGNWQMQAIIGGTAVPAAAVKGTQSAVARILGEASVNPEFYSAKFTNTLLEAQREGQIKDLQRTLDEARMLRLYAYTGLEMPVTSMNYKLANRIYNESLLEHGENRKAQAANAGQRKQGGATYDGAEYGSKDWNQKVKGLDSAMRSQMDAIAGIAQRAGVMVDFTEMDSKVYGEESKSGIRINVGGLNYGIVNGEEAATGRHHMMVTFGHELTHWLQDHSMNGYNRLERYVMQTYAQQEGTQALTNRLNHHMSAWGLNLEDAISELVADSCDQILANESVMKRIEETDRSLFGEVRNFVQNLVDRIKKAVTGMSGSASRDAKVLAKSANQLAKVWLGAYDEALNRVGTEPEAAEEQPAEAKQGRVNKADTDNQYMQAVKNGNVEEQQRLIRQAAEAAGYTEKVYHGTSSFGFTEFDSNKKGNGAIFTSYKIGQAQTYANDSEVRGITEELDVPFTRKNDGVYQLFAKPGKQLVINANRNLWSGIDLEKSGILEDIQKYIRENMAEDHDLMFDRELFADPGPDNLFTTNEIAAYAKAAGYDSVRIKNVLDGGGLNGQTLNSLGDVAIFFNPADVKSADPVVYDNDGNVIPLSERFNSNKTDIRWSRSEAQEKAVQVAEENGIDLNLDNHTASKYSRASYERSDYYQHPEEMARMLAKNVLGSYSKENLEKAARWIQDVTSVSAMIADRSDVLDYIPSEGRTSFKSNPEYGGSIDSSTICPKRWLQSGTIDAIQRALPDYAMTAEDFLQVRRMMKDRGYEVSCGLCFVESSRKNIAKYAAQFMNEWNSQHPDNKTNMIEINTVLGLEETRANKPEVYAAYEKFMNKLAQRKPKLFEMRSEYNNDIIKHFRNDSSVEEKNKRGGMRINSFSDFEIVHLIDMMQVIMDMGNVGLAGQAYTKVREFSEALGPTGLKINMSMIAKGVGEDGRIIFDEVEGMKWKDVEDLRDRYADNVGTICVIFTEDQLMAAMNDDRIDFIIPFHRSQWSKSNYKDIGLPENVKDFTYWQNERYAKPVYGQKKDGTLKKLRATNYMPNEYWKFELSGKENAELYLKKCAAENKIPKFWKWLQPNGDGSFSLKDDGSTDGYWKLLIDFKMYNHLTNEGAPQMPVVPQFDMDACRRMLDEYKGGHSTFPVAEDVVRDFVEEKKKGSRKGIARGKGGKITMAGNDFEGARLSRSEESYDVENWLGNMTYSGLQTEDERILMETFKGLRVSMSLSLHKQVLYQNRIKELESKKVLDADARHELETLQNKLEGQRWRQAELEKEIADVTSSEGYAGMMYKHNMLFKDFLDGRTQDEVTQKVNELMSQVKEIDRDIEKKSRELKQLSQTKTVQTLENLLAKDPETGKQVKNLMAKIKEINSQYGDIAGEMESLQDQLKQTLETAISVKGWSEALRNDMKSAIDYYNKTAAVAAQTERQKVKNGVIKMLKSENTKKLIAQQEKYRQMMKDDREARRTVAEIQAARYKINTNIRTIKNLLTAETDQKNIPEEAKPLARMMAGMIARHDASADRHVILADKKQLADFMERLDRMDKASGPFDMDSDLDFLVIKAPNAEDNDYSLRDKVLQDLMDIESGLVEYRNAEGLGKVSLNDRKAALTKIQEAVSEITTVIRRRGEAFINGKRYETADLAEKMESEMQGSKFFKDKKLEPVNAVSKAVAWGNLTPEYFFKNLKNSVMTLLHKGFHNAENRSGLEAVRSRDKIAQIEQETGYATWDGQEKHQIKANGGRMVEITTEQLMSLYATWLREKNAMRPEATAHLLHGGFVLAEGELVPIRMSEDKLDALAGELTPQQKEYVDRIVEYMSGELAELGNEASMEAYGIRKFTEKYYFPIKSWGGVLNKSSNRGVSNANDNRAMRQSFTRRVQANAQNAIEIGDFTPTAMKHIVGMITFNTVGPAVENLNKVLNQQLQYGDVVRGEDGEITEDNRYKINLAASFRRYYGEEAYNYLSRWMDDINGGVGRKAEKSFKEKLLTIFRKGAVAGSLSVAAQQPLSYIRAATMVSPKYLAAAVMPNHWGKIHDEMLKYSGVAVIKDMGRFDMNQGQSMQEYIAPKGKTSILQKAMDATTILPEKMDALTWGRMWIACKLEQQAKNPGVDVKSDAFLEKVAERFNEVMRRTQVYDSVMVKSQNMRSQNYAIKSITSFMGEPTLTLNVLADAVQNARQKGGMKHLGAAVATFVLSAALQAFVKAGMSSGRSPDKKKRWDEQFQAKWFSMFISEADPLTLIPGFSDMVEILKEGELKDDAMGVLGKVKTIWKTSVNWVSGKNEDHYRNFEDTVGQVLQIFTNVPVKNLMRDARAIYNWCNPDTYAKREYSGAVVRGEMLNALHDSDNIIGVINSYLNTAGMGFDTSSKGYVQRVYNAEKAGKKDKAEEFKEYLRMGLGKKDKDITSELRTLTKKDDTLSSSQKIRQLRRQGMADSDIASWITTQYKDGKFSKAQAVKLYLEANPKKTENEAYYYFEQAEYEKKNKVDLPNSDYFRMKEALKTQDKAAYKEAVKELKDHGHDDNDVKEQTKSYFTEGYKKGTISRKDAEKGLRQYRSDLTEDDIWWTLDLIDYRKETGNSEASGKYYRLYDALDANKSDSIKAAVQTMVKHGMEPKNIKSQVNSRYKQEYLTSSQQGKTRIVDAMNKVYKALGFTTDDVSKTIKGWTKAKKK